MDIRISGHQVETGDALRTHVTDRLQGIAEKYFARAISSEVTFGKGPHDVGFKCDIVMHVTRGLVLKGRHDAQDAHLALTGRHQDRKAASPLFAPPEGPQPGPGDRTG